MKKKGLTESANKENEEIFKFFCEKKAEVMKLASLCQFLSTKAKDLAREHVEKLSKSDEERELKLKKLESDTELLSKEKAALASEIDLLNNEKVILVSVFEKLNKEKAMLSNYTRKRRVS